MDGRARGKASACFPFSHDISAELWHSTPVKKKNAPPDLSQISVLTSFRMDNTAKQWAERTPPIPADTPGPRSSLDTEFPVKDVSGSTIQRQRRELQLLMAELKDRDRELNTMSTSHHKQLHAWEQDRQRVLTLEQRCTRLDDELQKRYEVIRVLTKRVWVVETREKEVQRELSAAQRQLSELEQKQQHVSQTCQDFEEKNQSLNSTLMALSSQVGSLQVREEELSSMLKLKDKDVTEASGQILDLTGRIRDLETSLTESLSRETKLLRELEESKRRHREARHEVTHLKEELQQQVTQSSSQREEIIRLKQELQLLHRDLALTGEGDSWKDELLELARSKQERTMTELRCLRQVCENQRNDLQLLQLNLESARETLKAKTSGRLLGRGATVLESVNIEGMKGEERPSCRRSSEPRRRKRHGPAERSELTDTLSDVTVTLPDLTFNANSVSPHRRPRSRGNRSTFTSYMLGSRSKDGRRAANRVQDQPCGENRT
ncbi:coiled-coil domain-containing protein 62 isoform X2 [Seriola aureovittata]|uniref:coiled-coil domain-containing protein 62 isoform X2 n=1 Tax=Seriola aureovittata TaxID=2871759 RepID=UPI0024BEE846|nr:coiled-coil domain-containing protein 62 isoform X2 [Seriola aureovittata]